uniref:C2H2-type domain-containing protein n=1 Tax=Esox lucius TaxID=8010 RepID=A0AAY5KEC5_ESOLU
MQTVAIINEHLTIGPPSSDDIVVNINCLLQLFQRCEECRQKSVIKTEGDRTCLSVTQHCHTCNHLRTWTSNSSAWTGSLEMEVTVDQPPRPGGSGPSLVRRKEGSKGAETRRRMTKVVFDSETVSTQSQEENGLSSWERSLREGLTESDSDFDLEDEAEEGLTESDSDFDPEEGKSKKGSGTPLQKSTDGPMQDSRRHFVLCPKCGILYSTRLQYRKCDHKFMITCPDCGKHCANEIGLKSHQKRQHSHDKIFPCKFCLQPFKTRPEKLTHQKSHRFTDYRCYSCSDCPLRFDNVFVRNRHVREHRKHICQICDKEFQKGHILNRHNLSHSDDKPFKCQVCQRAFAQASQLKSHLRVHTGERPFQCQRCDKSFNHNVSLKNHVRRYHNNEKSVSWKPFRAVLCV